MTNRTDTYKIAHFEYDDEEFRDVLHIVAFLTSSPNHDAPYATSKESPIVFQMTLNFCENESHITSIGSEAFEANPSYVPSVLCEFSKLFENTYCKMHHSLSPHDAMMKLDQETFTVSY